MANNVEEIVLNLKDNVSSKLGGIQGQVSGMRSALTGLGGVLAGIGIASFMADSVKAYNEQEVGLAKVAQSIKTTGGIAGKSLDELQKKASDFQNNSLFTDETILSDVTSTLLTFTSITGEAFDKTQQYALDLSAKFGQELKGSAIQLGKALNDPVQGVSALRRVGISFTDQQLEMIKSFQTAGDMASAQGVIFAELEKQVGGTAKAVSEVGSGQMQVAMNAIGDLKEPVGELIMLFVSELVPAIKSVTAVLGEFLGWLVENKKMILDVSKVVGVAIVAYYGLQFALNLSTIATNLLNIAMAINPFTAWIVAITALVTWLVYAYHKFDGFREMVDGFVNVLKTLASNIASIFSGDLKWDSLEDAYKSGVAMSKKLTEEEKKRKKEEESKKQNVLAGVGQAPKNKFSDVATVGKGMTKSASPTSAIGSTAPKNFYININKLVETLSFTTQNLTESKAKIKEEISRVLLEVVNDSQIVAKA